MKLQNVIINRIQGRIIGATGGLYPLRLINRKKLGTLRKYDGKGNGNLEKAIKTTTLQVNRAFLELSLPSLHNYSAKWPILS